MFSLVETILDVRLVANLPKPVLQLLVDFPLAQRLRGLGTLYFLGAIAITATEHLYDVPSELGFEGLADFIDGKRVHGLLEWRYRVTGTQPPKISALDGGSPIVGVGSGELVEIGTVHDSRAKHDQPGTRLIVADDFVGLDENVPGVRLVDDETFGAARIHQLDDVKAAGAAHDFGELALVQLRHDVLEQRRQLLGLAPAQIPAFQCLPAVGLGGRGAAEIGTGVQPGDDVLGLVPGVGQLFRRGTVGNRDQNMPDAILGIVAALLLPGREVIVDVPIGDLDAILDLTLLNPALDELAANFFAESGEVVAVARENVTEFTQAQIVLPGDIRDLSIEGLVVDTNSRGRSDLQLQTIENQLLEHLFLQNVLRRRGHAGLSQLFDDGLQARLHFAVDDDVVVDHRHDPVDLNDLRRRQGLRTGRRGQRKAGDQGGRG